MSRYDCHGDGESEIVQVECLSPLRFIDVYTYIHIGMNGSLFLAGFCTRKCEH